MTETNLGLAPAVVDLEPALVFRRFASPDVEWVEVDGEIVAWSEEHESLHLLDSIASLVFQLMDGQTTLAITIDDLADAFGRTPQEIAPDIKACVAALEQMGMLERVA